jgi:hypothetical protein
MFSKMCVTIARKLRFWHSVFSQKYNFEADEKKSTILRVLAKTEEITRDPRVLDP